jgi:hypothetical protein
MIFLSDNAMLERDLTFEDIKPRYENPVVLFNLLRVVDFSAIGEHVLVLHSHMLI